VAYAFRVAQLSGAERIVRTANQPRVDLYYHRDRTLDEAGAN